jgi:hypothetical protein
MSFDWQDITPIYKGEAYRPYFLTHNHWYLYDDYLAFIGMLKYYF